LFDEEEDFEISATGQTPDDDVFDATVGVLQEVLLEENFEMLQKKFCQENCLKFECSEENKLIYMDIFKKYNDVIESYIEKRLKEEISGFSMELFLGEVAKRKE
jgi:ADP-ribosylation factor 2-binding protein